MKPDEEQQLLPRIPPATLAQALHQLLENHLFDGAPIPPASLGRRIPYNVILVLALAYAMPSGNPYWEIGSDFLAKVVGLTGDSLQVAIPATYLGTSGVVTNSLFNMWVMLRYLESNWKPANEAEKILYDSAHRRHHYIKKAALYTEAIFANAALMYLSYQEEGKVDFWFMNAAIIGFFIAYVSLDLFVDSAAWFARTLKQFSVDLWRLFSDTKAPAYEDLQAMMKNYFSKLHQRYKKNRFARMPENKNDFFQSVETDNKRSETVVQFLRRHTIYALPYLSGTVISLILMGSRLGIVSKAHNAAEFITDEWFGLKQPIVRLVSIWTMTALAAIPSIAFGFKAFNALGRALHNTGLRVITCSSNNDKTVARQTYSSLFWTLLIGSGIFVAGSWAGSVDLTYEYAKNYIMGLMLYFTVTASAAVVTNGFGVKSLVDDVVARFARFYRWQGSGDNYQFANEEKFFNDYQEFLRRACQDPKAAIEFLLYFPEVYEQIKARGFNRFKEVAAEVTFTYEEIQNIKEYLRQDEFKLRIILGELGFTGKQLNSFFKKPIKVENAGATPFWKRVIPSVPDCVPRVTIGCYR